MHFHRYTLGLAAAIALSAGSAILAAQQPQPAFIVDKDDVTIRGCVKRADIQTPAASQMLIWSRSDIMLAGVAAAKTTAPSPVQPGGVSERVFYWIDDDEDLTKHVGQFVELKGKMNDFEVGKFKIDADGDFTKVELELEGRKETAKIPTAWIAGVNTDKKQEFKIVARRVKVSDDVKILGTCGL